MHTSHHCHSKDTQKHCYQGDEKCPDSESVATLGSRRHERRKMQCSAFHGGGGGNQRRVAQRGPGVAALPKFGRPSLLRLVVGRLSEWVYVGLRLRGNGLCGAVRLRLAADARVHEQRRNVMQRDVRVRC